MNSILIAIIAIVLALACIFLAFRFGKYFFRFFLGFFFLCLIGIIVLAAFVANDVSNFKEGITREPSLFILAEEDNVLASMALNPIHKQTGGDVLEETLSNATRDLYGEDYSESNDFDLPFTFISREKRLFYSDLLANDQIENMSEEYFSVFIINADVYDEHMGDIVSLGDVSLSVEEIFQVLESDNASSKMVSFISIKESMPADLAYEQLRSSIGDSSQVRGVLFMLLIQNLVGEEVRDVTPMLKLFQKENLIVYPETIMFKVLKGIPEPVFKSIEDKLAGTQDGNNE